MVRAGLSSLSATPRRPASRHYSGSVAEPSELTAEPVKAPALGPAAIVMAVEGLVAAGYGVYLVTQANSARLIVGLGAGALLLGYGVALVFVGRGLARARRWSRGPAVATQLVQLLLAWNFRDGATWWFALLLALSAAAVLVCVFLPRSTAALISRP